MSIIKSIKVGNETVPFVSTLTDMPSRTQAWTPSDTNNLPSGVRGVMVDADGAVAFEYSDGSSDVLLLQAGAYYGLLQPRKIKATGTTATGIHLLF